MNKTYLVVLSVPYNRDMITRVLNNHPSVSFWFYSLPYSIFVQTTMSAQELSELLMSHFGGYRHFVTEVSSNRWGLLPQDHWKYFK